MNSGTIIFGLVFAIIPIGIAFARGHKHKWAIVALSIFLGIIGGVIGLIWAIIGSTERPQKYAR